MLPNEKMNLNASLTLLANIGENVSKTTEELKNEYQNVEWQKIKEFRNRKDNKRKNESESI